MNSAESKLPIEWRTPDAPFTADGLSPAPDYFECELTTLATRQHGRRTGIAVKGRSVDGDRREESKEKELGVHGVGRAFRNAMGCVVLIQELE